MDIPGVQDDWEHQMNPLLQDMSHCAAGGSGANVDDDYHFNPTEVSGKFRDYGNIQEENSSKNDLRAEGNDIFKFQI